jgi:hypothetical protein
MSKRFTSTELWVEDWFCEMPMEYKLYWYYMLSKCNHAGIFKVNTKMFNNINECNLNHESALNYFNTDKSRIRVINDNVWFIEDYFFYQYGKSFNIKNRVHKSIYDVYYQYNIELTSIRGVLEFNIGDNNEVIGVDTDRVKDTYINSNNINNNKESKNLKNSNLFRQPNIPTKEQVWEFFQGVKGTKEMAKAFYDKYDGLGWFLNNSPIVKWQSLANTFVTNWNKIEEQRKNKNSYNNEQPKIQTLRKLPNSPTPRYD